MHIINVHCVNKTCFVERQSGFKMNLCFLLNSCCLISHRSFCLWVSALVCFDSLSLLVCLTDLWVSNMPCDLTSLMDLRRFADLWSIQRVRTLTIFMLQTCWTRNWISIISLSQIFSFGSYIDFLMSLVFCMCYTLSHQAESLRKLFQSVCQVNWKAFFGFIF